MGAQKRFLVTGATTEDAEKLDLGHYNCVGVLENLAFNDFGRLIEYTQSRFAPDSFVLTYFVKND